MVRRISKLTARRQPRASYTCFLSHSSRDSEFVSKLYGDLRQRGIGCFYFPEDARWCESVWEEIGDAIREYDKCVVVCSENALRSGLADGGLIRKPDIMSKVVGDFRGWDTDEGSYVSSLEKLIKGLDTE